MEEVTVVVLTGCHHSTNVSVTLVIVQLNYSNSFCGLFLMKIFSDVKRRW